MKNSPASKEVTPSGSLEDKLEGIIKTLPPGTVTLTKIMHIIGSDSLMLITIFLSLIFLIPVSIPGVSTVFGSAILLIGVSLLFSNKLYMPKRIQERPLSSEKLVKGMNGALVWLRRLEKISKPGRLPWLATRAQLFNKLAYILAALLLMMPFGFVPFSNTLPAIALIFFAIGAIQKDGLSILFGHLMNVATIIYFGALIAAGGWTILEVIQKMQGG